MPLIGNAPRIEAWEDDLTHWHVWHDGMGWRAEKDCLHPDIYRVGPFPRFIDVVDAALEKERAK